MTAIQVNIGRRIRPPIVAVVAVLTMLVPPQPGMAQTPSAVIHFGDSNTASDSANNLPPPPPVPVTDGNAEKSAPRTKQNPWDLIPTADELIQASCPSCGSQPPMPPGPLGGPVDAAHPPGTRLRDTLFWGCLNCGVGDCHPGAKECYPCCQTDSACERFFCNLYHCICCPDPCYEGKWQPIADSAFFVEGARPVSQTRIRWDDGVNLILPDRSEYFWARADGKGRGPTPPAPFLGETRLHYNDLSMYTEVASGMFSFIFEMPYRSIDPDIDPHAAGFGDMNIATKSLLFDCDLLQVSFMMRTYLPVGNANKGLGTGHVSLEPSLVVGIKLHEDAYLQGQLAEWIPLGGDPAYAGAILHYHFSVNQVLFRIVSNVPVVGTLEFSGYSFQDGAYTDPVLGPYQRSSGSTYAYLGAGLRVFVCNRIDFGFGFEMALTDQHFADQLYRTEFRWRY